MILFVILGRKKVANVILTRVSYAQTLNVIILLIAKTSIIVIGRVSLILMSHAKPIIVGSMGVLSATITLNLIMIIELYEFSLTKIFFQILSHLLKLK